MVILILWGKFWFAHWQGSSTKLIIIVCRGWKTFRKLQQISKEILILKVYIKLAAHPLCNFLQLLLIINAIFPIKI